MNSYYHAKASARKWGGTPDQYIEIHEFIDSSKRIIGDVRHRSMYHHTEGVWLCQRIFGRTITVGGRVPIAPELTLLESDEATTRPAFEYEDHGPIRQVPVRLIAELHIEQDLGWLPSPKDYIDGMILKPWMGGPVRTERPLTEIFPTEIYMDKPRNRILNDPPLPPPPPFTGSPLAPPNPRQQISSDPNDPPPAPLVADPNLITYMISSGTKVPPKKGKKNEFSRNAN